MKEDQIGLLKFIMDEQIYCINETSHTIQDINDMFFIDFIAYNNMHYNAYKKEVKDAS